MTKLHITQHKPFLSLVLAEVERTDTSIFDNFTKNQVARVAKKIAKIIDIIENSETDADCYKATTSNTFIEIIDEIIEYLIDCELNTEVGIMKLLRNDVASEQERISSILRQIKG